MPKQKSKFKYERSDYEKKAVKFLNKKSYTCIKRLGSGTFGDVIAIRKNDSETIAAKVIHKTYTSAGEIYLWPCLRHPNVLPLIERLHYKNLDIFLTPLMIDCLCNILKDAAFRNNSKLFEMTVGWMKDMLTGLEYLHAYGVCHLDIKEDNILISSDMRAVISDFSGIAETKEPVTRCLLPRCYSPTETWIDENEQLSVDGEKVDIWGAGLVIFYCFSNRWVERKKEKMSLTTKIFFETDKWICDEYPWIFKCLQEPFFTSLLKSAHPASAISKEECAVALNLLQGTLRYSPDSRPSAKDVLGHRLFSSTLGCGNLLEPDEIWISKQSDTYEPKTPDNKKEVHQVSTIQSFKVVDRIDEDASDSELVPASPDIDTGKENVKCDDTGSYTVQPKIVKISNAQSSKDTNDVNDVKEENKGSLCKRIRNMFNRFRKSFTRKKS